MTELYPPAKRRPMAKRHLSVWLFAAWTLVIFLHSIQPADLSGQESGWILSLLLGLFPWLTDHIVRKAAHFTEFAVLGLLSEPLGRERLCGGKTGFPPCAAVWFSLSLCGLTALCDETIQLFVDGRSAQVSDVWLDIGGAAFGLLLAALFHGIRGKTRVRSGPAA